MTVTAHVHNLTMLRHYFGQRLREQEAMEPTLPESQERPYKVMKNEVVIYPHEGRLRLMFRYDKSWVNFIKALPYPKYDQQNRWWTVPDTEVIRKDIETYAQERGWKISYSAKRRSLYTCVT